MQTLQRDADLQHKVDPFQKLVHKPEVQPVGLPLNIVPPVASTSVHGPGGGSVESLSQTFGGMFGEGHEQAPSAELAAAPAAKTKPGVYQGVTDLTGEYGGLAAGKRSGTQGVVLHRTNATTAARTLTDYKTRIRQGSSIGAQYLIDEKGATSLIAPVDSLVSHSKGFSDATVGVEVTGQAQHLDRSGRHGTLRDQVTGLNLSPEMKARLLGYDDKRLSSVLSSNGDNVYKDISGAQKRSVWNLSNHLASDYGLDLNSLSEHGAGESGANHYSRKTLPDFSAHEHINPKTLGEGEPMVEFLRARQQYPQLVAQAEQRLAALRASGGDPAQLARYEALVSKESSTLGSLNVDGTATEAQALKAEQQTGKPGEATAREQQRTDFYDHFYDRIGALKGAVK